MSIILSDSKNERLQIATNVCVCVLVTLDCGRTIHDTRYDGKSFMEPFEKKTFEKVAQLGTLEELQDWKMDKNVWNN